MFTTSRRAAINGVIFTVATALAFSTVIAIMFNGVIKHAITVLAFVR